MGARSFLASLFRKAQPLPHVVVQPRCTCGRFCSTHEAPTDVVSKLVSELTAQGAYVPEKFRSRPLIQEGGE